MYLIVILKQQFITAGSIYFFDDALCTSKHFK
jgi:hypothetical protein